jgi:hypothetical protein
MSTPRPKKLPKPHPEHKEPEGMSLWTQAALAAVIFLVISTGYSLVREYIVHQDEIVPVSQIAAGNKTAFTGAKADIKVARADLAAARADAGKIVTGLKVFKSATTTSTAVTATTTAQ